MCLCLHSFKANRSTIRSVRTANDAQSETLISLRSRLISKWVSFDIQCFLVLLISSQNNATLEDRLGALLEPEILSGDNKYMNAVTPQEESLTNTHPRYLCQRCDSLQDAKRYTELRELPPVLHFSLLRFVYDLSSMERKKSKQTILIPTFIDMDGFIGPDEVRKQRKKKHAKESKNLYELRGVLLHKGTSAYHGHYEAQVFDVRCAQSSVTFHAGSSCVVPVQEPGVVPVQRRGSDQDRFTHSQARRREERGEGLEGHQVITISVSCGRNTKSIIRKPANAPTRGRPPKKRRRIDSDSDIEIIE